MDAKFIVVLKKHPLGSYRKLIELGIPTFYTFSLILSFHQTGPTGLFEMVPTIPPFLLHSPPLKILLDTPHPSQG
jgi:hypothetical protein